MKYKEWKSIQHRICNSCLENKLLANFKSDNQICNTCRLPEYMKVRRERDYQGELEKLKEEKCPNLNNDNLELRVNINHQVHTFCIGLNGVAFK